MALAESGTGIEMAALPSADAGMSPVIDVRNGVLGFVRQLEAMPPETPFHYGKGIASTCGATAASIRAALAAGNVDAHPASAFWALAVDGEQ